MEAESSISDKVYQHSYIFRTVIFVVGVGNSFEKSRVPFLFWSKSIAKVLGVSSLKWFRIPDSWEKLPFPLYLSQFRSQLKIRCNKKNKNTLFLKERAGKEALDYHRSYPLQKSSALLATSSSFSNEKGYWASSRSNLWYYLTHSTLVIVLLSTECRHFRSIILMLAISQRMRMICYEPEKNPRWQETATERWSSQTFR